MSEIKLIIRDLESELFGVVCGSVGDRVVAALSADPETIDELELAFGRFLRSDERDPKKCPDAEPRLRRWLTSHGDDEPYDAGLVVIDLAARLVVINSTYSSPEHRGIVFDPSNQQDGSLGPPNYYHLADDWDFDYDLDVWPSLANARRKKRASQPPMDVRSVLFGEPLLDFIVQHCWDAFQCPPLGPSESEQGPPTRESISLTLAMQHPEVERNYRAIEWYNELFRQLHEHWLLSPRCDLQHRSPRDVIVEKREHIDLDLQDRYKQWADQGRCPAPISVDSHAWRFAGLGTAEIVVYYDMVRFLLQKCWEDLELEAETAKTIPVPESFTRGEMAALALARDEWLATPNPDYYDQAPHWFLLRERKRIPLAATNDEVQSDCNCPVCQILLEKGVPMLIGLDGSDMDEGFAFDFWCLDLEQWEQEQARSNATAEKAAILAEVEEELGLPDLDFAVLEQLNNPKVQSW